jgi:hypothetical protein
VRCWDVLWFVWLDVIGAMSSSAAVLGACLCLQESLFASVGSGLHRTNHEPPRSLYAAALWFSAMSAIGSSSD